MPHVLMVSQPTIAGVAQCVLDWSVGIAERGWQVTVACPSDGWLRQRCAAAGLATAPFESERSPTANVAGESRQLAAIVADTQPDVVMLHSSKAGLIGRLVMRGTLPTVFVPHAWSFDAAAGAQGHAARIWERLAAARWTDLVVCVSSAEYHRGREAGIRATYQVIRNGVDVAGIQAIAARADANAMKESNGVEPDTPMVVCLGRLTAQKGQDTLIDGWLRRRWEAPAQLVLVGDGPDEAALRQRAGTDSSITFTGAVTREEAIAWLAAATVVATPSRWEGMALVPLEALAVGTPVVASDVTGLAEVVGATGSDGATGELVPPDDADALADALGRWLTLDEGSLAVLRLRAQARAASEFDVGRTIADVDNALRDLVSR